MDDFENKGSWTRKVFADFIDEYQQVTFLCCKTLGLNETEAEDVASETFLAAYKKLDKFRGQSKLSTWIWKIAYYKAIDYIRKNRRDLRVLDEIDDQLADKKIAQVAAELENKVKQRTQELESSRREVIYCLARAAELGFEKERGQTLREFLRTLRRRGISNQNFPTLRDYHYLVQFDGARRNDSQERQMRRDSRKWVQ